MKDFSKGRTYSLLAAISWGSLPVFIKKGLNSGQPSLSPMDGLLISLIVGILGYTFFLLIKGEAKSLFHVNRSSALFFAIAGLFSSVGMIFYYLSLSLTLAVIVTPIQSTHRIITALISYVFIQHLERITWRFMLGALLSCIGVILIVI